MGRDGLGPCHTPAEGAHQMAGAPSSAGQAACLSYLGIFSSFPQGLLQTLSSSEGSSENKIPY
jgi:hypothetical protein